MAHRQRFNSTSLTTGITRFALAASGNAFNVNTVAVTPVPMLTNVTIHADTWRRHVGGPNTRFELRRSARFVQLSAAPILSGGGTKARILFQWRKNGVTILHGSTVSDFNVGEFSAFDLSPAIGNYYELVCSRYSGGAAAQTLDINLATISCQAFLI